MLGLKLIHVSKRGYSCSGCWSFITVLVRIMSVHLTVIQYIYLSGCMPLSTQLFYTMNHPQSELESVDFIQMFHTAENTYTGTHITFIHPFLPGDMHSHFCTLHSAVWETHLSSIFPGNNPKSVLEIPTGVPVQGRQLLRRTGNFLLIFFNFISMIWHSRHEDLQLFLLIFKQWPQLCLQWCENGQLMTGRYKQSGNQQAGIFFVQYKKG